MGKSIQTAGYNGARTVIKQANQITDPEVEILKMLPPDWRD